MKNPAQQIAEAIDSAMQSMIVKGKPISQSELSRRSGVPQATISRTLKGLSIPETNTLSRLIAVLGEDNVKIPQEVLMLVPSSPLTDQERMNAFILHKMAAVEAALHITASSDPAMFEKFADQFRIYKEAMTEPGSTSGDEESQIRLEAIESTMNAVFWKQTKD